MWASVTGTGPSIGVILAQAGKHEVKSRLENPWIRGGFRTPFLLGSR